MTDVQATTVASGFKFLEAPRWHEDRIWFSDFYGYRVYSAREDGSDLRTEASVPRQPAGLGWLPDGRLLVVSMRDRTVLRREPDGTLVVHADLNAYATGHANDMAVDAAGRAYVGNFGFDLMSGARWKRVAVPGGPRRHRDRGSRRSVFPQRQRDHAGRRPDRQRDLRKPLHRVRPDRRRGAGQPSRLGGVRPAAGRPRRTRSPRSRSRPTAAASTPRARSGSPTPPAAGCSGSRRAARSPTSCAPGPRCSPARSAAPTGGPCTPAPPRTSSRRPGSPPTKRR